MTQKYTQESIKSAPKGPFADRFKHYIENQTVKIGDVNIDFGHDLIIPDKKENAGSWQKREVKLPFGKSVAGEFPVFTFNQMSLGDFYANLRKSTIYKGMFEAIGRATIMAETAVPNPFMKFMEPPLEYGNAILDGMFTNLHSRPWIKYDRGSGRPLMFDLEVPELQTSVARCEFSREIPLKINEIEYRQFSQTGAMVGEIAGALAGEVAYCYERDMYEAAKEYFMGCIRIEPEPEGATDIMSTTELKKSDMITCLSVSKTQRADNQCMAQLFQTMLHEITDKKLRFPSTKYNPLHRETASKSLSLIMDAKYQYPLFMEFLSKTYHPEYVKIGPILEEIWIDDIPQLQGQIYPNNWELAGMIVDNRALAITPVTPYQIGNYTNAQEGSNNVFAHYEYIFRMKPFFNRMYIFIETTGS